MLIYIIKIFSIIFLLYMVWKLSGENTRQYSKIRELRDQIHDQKELTDRYRVLNLGNGVEAIRMGNTWYARFKDHVFVWNGEEFRCIESTQRHLEVCRYCHRHDEKVKRITTDGLNGYYHPFCASEIIREVREELAERMSCKKNGDQ